MQPLDRAAVQHAQIKVERLVVHLVAARGRNHLNNVLQFVVVLQRHDFMLQLAQLGHVVGGRGLIATAIDCERIVDHAGRQLSDCRCTVITAAAVLNATRLLRIVRMVVCR